VKLTNIVDSGNSYVYSTSYRFVLVPDYAFSPATTVGPTDGDIGKAVSFIWRRRSRPLLGQLHLSLCEAVEKWSLFQLHRLSVLAWSLGGGGRRSVEALGILAKGAREAGDTFPLDDLALGAVQSFAPTAPPDPRLLQQGKDAWSKWTSDGYLALAESLGWRSVDEDYWTNKKWQAEVDRREQLGLCTRCGRPKEKGDYCQNCFDDIMLRHKPRLDRRLAGFDLQSDSR
jgi:hypothetical protein